MAMNIKNAKVERLAEELAPEKLRLAQALDFLEREIWPHIPRKLLERRMAKTERERLLGYRRGGF